MASSSTAAASPPPPSPLTTTTTTQAPLLVDIGANLTNRQFQRDLPQVLQRAADAGVATVLVTGTSMRSSRDALQLVKRNLRHAHRRHGNSSNSNSNSKDTNHHHHRHSNVTLFSTVGVHPHDAKDFDDAHSIAEMRALITASPGTVVAVGECGLDFNRDFSPRDKQQRVFRAQVELACELGLPLFLHERDAHAAFVSVLQPFVDAQRLPPVVVHCFTGNERELRTYLAMGFYIGLTGCVCMDSRGAKLRAMAASIPRDRLLIETDAPFMYPYSGGNGGRRARCEPKDLRAVAQTLAACYGVSFDEIAAATTANARQFFALDKRAALQVEAVAAESAAAPTNSVSKDLELKRAAPHTPASTRTSATSDATTTTTSDSATHAAAATVSTAALSQTAQATGDDADVIVLDGGSGEGGGQLLRVSVALAAVLSKRIRVHSVRANRKTPGLRNQHVHTLQLARDLASGSVLLGAQLNSTEIMFTGAGAGVASADGHHIRENSASESSGGGGADSEHTGTRDRELTASSQTGGSVSLMIQGALPVMVFGARATTLRLRGGTHAGFSPPVDFMAVPLQQLLQRFGVDASLAITSRGFGIGESGDVAFRVSPLARGATLSPIDLSTASDAITQLYVRVTVCGSTADAATGEQYERALQTALRARLGASLSSETVRASDVLVEVTRAKSSNRGGRKARGAMAGKGKDTHANKRERPHASLLVVAETRTGGLLSVDRSGKDAPAAMAAAVAQTLAQYVADGVCVDEHLADNAIVFMALAAGVSRLRVPARAARSSQHLETALAVVAQVAGATVRLDEGAQSSVVEVRGIGWVGP